MFALYETEVDSASEWSSPEIANFARKISRSILL